MTALSSSIFGQHLNKLRNKRRWTTRKLTDELDLIACTEIGTEDPTTDERYRVIDGSLITRWEKGTRHPTSFYVICLIKLFQADLDFVRALAWAKQAKYCPDQEDLESVFPNAFFQPPPPPQLHNTLTHLEPLPTHRLFGVAQVQTELDYALQQKDDHWVVSIEGIGGIGKTSLASQLVRAVLRAHRFYDIAWISAKQERFDPHQGIRPIDRPILEAETFVDRLLEQLNPTLPLARSPQEKLALLTHWLTTHPYLIVIDNLETVADYNALMPTLRRLVRPTKFLLTSREHIEDIYSRRLEELSRPETAAFLRYMGERQNLLALARAPETQLNRIYDIAGGNPLALKLIIGQLQIGLYSLSQLLDNLKQARGKTIEALYTFIYWQSWHDLDEAARRLFVLMPQMPNATAEDLARKSKLTDEQLRRTIYELTTRSLIEVRDDLEEPYYYLHRLTETFLLNEVLQWKSLV